jgi:hypothetical protein
MPPATVAGAEPLGRVHHQQLADEVLRDARHKLRRE